MWIKLKNNVRYKFRFWFLLEMFVRIVITAVCIFVLQDNVSDFRTVRIIGYVFMVWCLRPAYMNLSALYKEWKLQEWAYKNKNSYKTQEKKE